MYVRVEVAMRPEFVDPAASMQLRKIALALPEVHRRVRWARLLDVYWLDIDIPREKLISAISEIFHDPVLKWLFTGDLIPSAADKHGGMADLMAAAPERPGVFWGLEKHYRPGVTDNVGRTAREAFEIVLSERLPEAKVASGQLLVLEGPKLDEDGLARVAREVLANELIESWTILSHDELVRNSRFHADQVRRQLPRVRTYALRMTGRLSSKKEEGPETFNLSHMDDEDLVKLSQSRLWALSREEIQAVRAHFNRAEVMVEREKRGMAEPTDVEMEVIAQTWSEHCKHKIFAARVRYVDQSAANADRIENIPSTIEGLFKETIVRTTREIQRPWLLSVFDDNAGIVAFDDESALCLKVETHNSPSALDPYGGALTGIVGVNRDIMGCGFGARPIFNTDVFCVAQPDYLQPLPDRILHPRRILDGIRRGVEHGGNKSGIPTVNGALVFDSRYLGKPLVYCGTGGLMPRRIGERRCEEKKIEVGDLICMVGGRIGKDGIHGATFSSLALDENSPVTAVQLGDPITQKRAMDFLLEARDRGLYRTLTDNGAGGLSSSVGELARLTGGARMDVAKAKTKYPGLKPYELVVSESQERMTIAVAPDRIEAFTALAESRGVEVSVLGEFTQSGYFEIFHGQQQVACLELEFLHQGLPKMELRAEWRGRPAAPGTADLDFAAEGPKKLVDLLGRPNIASKEWLIRQYDHEVQGTSVVKPLHSSVVGTEEEKSGPNDGAVLKPKFNSNEGIAVGCGINPKLSDIDPYLMAQAVVDEAVRNVVAVGAEYGLERSLMALTDNFCWPDPVNAPEKMGALVRACYGMREAALELQTPFISGKDSMKNDYRGKRDGKDVVISVPPTLLVTAVAKVADVRRARTSDFKASGDHVYLLGGQGFGLQGSELHALMMDRLREKGGNQGQVVLPSLVTGTGTTQAARVPQPDWEVARRIYRWLGGTEGERQLAIRSVHDVSEGGMLVTVAESILARGYGADLSIPDGVDAWEFCFGEGFHSFVLSIPELEMKDVESEWNFLNIPFLRLGVVTSQRELCVRWKASGGNEMIWKASVSDLRAAWEKEGYWE